MDDKIALSIPGTGAALGGDDHPLSDDTIYRMIARGELEAIKVGRRTLVTVSSIQNYVANAPRFRGVAA